MIKTNLKYFIIFLFFLYLVLLFSIFIISPNDVFLLGADSSSYIYPGLSFSEKLSLLQKDGSIMHNNTALYPIFLSLFFKIFNFEKSFLYIQLVQILFVFFIAYITSIVDFKFNSKDKILVFCLLIFNPNLFSNAFFAQTEILFTLFFIISIFFSIKFINNQENVYAGYLAIIFLCISLNIRPISQYYLLLFIIFFNFCFLYEKISLKNFLKINTIFILIIVIFVGPWIVRNKVIFDESFISSNKGYYALDNLSNLIKYSENISDDNSYDMALLMNSILMKNDNNGYKGICLKKQNIRKIECKDIVFEYSMKNIFEYDKKDILKSLGLSSINTYLSAGSSNLKVLFNQKGNNLWKEKIDFKSHKQLISGNVINQLIFLVSLIFSISIKILSIKGLYNLYTNNKNKIFYFFILVFIFSTILFMFVGNSRFRVPLEPLFIILSVYGLKKGFQK